MPTGAVTGAVTGGAAGAPGEAVAGGAGGAGGGVTTSLGLNTMPVLGGPATPWAAGRVRILSVDVNRLWGADRPPRRA